MEIEEEREVSYRYFDLIDREFSEFRLKISSRIYVIERKVFEEKLLVKFLRLGDTCSFSIKFF